MTRKYSRLLLGVAATMLLASTASANLLVNPGFENPATGGAPPEYFGATGWADFGGTTYTISAGPIGPAGAHTGDQVLKVFGFGGVYQQFAASAGQTWDGGAWALNDSFDLMGGGQVAAVNIEWIAADGITSLGAVLGPTITAATPADIWNFLTVSGVAIAGTSFARLVLITGDFLPGGQAGAPRFDDAFMLERVAIPVPAAVWLFGSALGMLGWIRRKAI
ncbi:MAG: hypothetical protein E4H19_05190 [Chromatiales bacterium]|jgi:hypothetical protein|nr:MAG: hypothetical protein E4H19_05190 [Chromatiales bacterium]